MGDYFYEKSKMYYEKYKAKKLVKKVGAIIKDGNKYLTLVREGKRAMFAGGSVEEGETTRQAVAREVFEECGAKVIKIKYLTKNYYSVDWEFEGTIFPNRRVSYTYLCEIEKGNLSALGVDGEFDKNTKLKWCTIKELEDQGVLFCDTDTAVKLYPEIVKEYFAKVVPYTDNMFAALNTAVWSGGSFIYVPKGVKLEKPLQSYFRINTELMGQFERTLIIVDDEASVHYVEGCTAPQYSAYSLHAAVVEIYVKENAYCRYSTVQNWSNNIINLVTKRTLVSKGGHMEWIDGNIGSNINMKYPACILNGEGAKGTTVSIAFAGSGQYQDTGAKMIHLAPNTTSQIISKSICRGGGKVNYRGTVRIAPKAENSKSHIECDTIILDDISTSDTIPTNIVENDTSYIEHEATVSKVNEEQLFYLMSRGLTETEATEMIVMGFIEPFAKELPMEYAVELNQLIKLEMKDSIG